jgi:hypothetical protein
MRAQHIEQAVTKLKKLPPERIAEVEDFIDFLNQRGCNESSPIHSAAEADDFPVISVGQWPEGLNLRREDLYGDDGR